MYIISVKTWKSYLAANRVLRGWLPPPPHSECWSNKWPQFYSRVTLFVLERPPREFDSKSFRKAFLFHFQCLFIEFIQQKEPKLKICTILQARTFSFMADNEK